MQTPRFSARILLVAAVFLLAGGPARAATIFQDHFNGAGGPLNGTTPDITPGGESWEAGDTWLDDGTAETPVAGGPTGQAAHLDFTPQSGQIYIATANLLNNQSNWIGFGFLPTDPAGGDWTVQDFSVRHSNAPGYAWVLTRNSSGNDQEGFLGGGTAGGQAWNGDVVDPAQPVELTVVLNTQGAFWTVEWFLNGASQGAPVAFGAADNPGIGGIGFSHDRSDTANAGATITSFSLTTPDAQPTPGPQPVPAAAASTLFFVVVLLSLLAWRRIRGTTQ